jgi:hypothetical protein
MSIWRDLNLGLLDTPELGALTALPPLPTSMEKTGDRALRCCVFLLIITEFREEASFSWLLCLRMCLCLLLLIVQADLFERLFYSRSWSLPMAVNGRSW